jgi:hypothetical protein
MESRASEVKVIEELGGRLVALTGIEPVLFALRGRRVNQLHHSAKEVEPKDT